MFDGIIRIRTHFLVIAMREEITRMKGCDEEEAVEHLMGVSHLSSPLGGLLKMFLLAESVPVEITFRGGTDGTRSD
jgi:hypothetical protein